MAITVNLYYTGTNGAALKFAQEMIESGTVERIKKEKGNLKYDYFVPLDDSETVLLIDSWSSQEAIMELREKYDLHMRVERYVDDGAIQTNDEQFIRK